MRSTGGGLIESQVMQHVVGVLQPTESSIQHARWVLWAPRGSLISWLLWPSLIDRP